jgi:hypothetical protein
MTANEILARGRNEIDVPDDWSIFPLQRSKVISGLLGWAFGIVVGLGLFGLVGNIVIPYNYQHGVAPAILTSIFLGLLLFVGLGSAWTFIADIRRIANISQHIIILTPSDFVKQEGQKVIHVPLVNVRHVTTRGTPSPDRNPASEINREEVPGAGESMMGFFAGRGMSSSGQRWRKKRMRTPTSLAFMDSRTEKEVTVLTDASYGDPYTIGAILKEYVLSVQQAVS